MTQEEKAKAYDEAIDRLRNAFYSNNSRMCEEYRDAVKRIIEPIFPELKESEDEKMLRLIKNVIMKSVPFLENVLDGGESITAKDAIAWLEKQGEHANFRSKIQIGDKVTRNDSGVLVNLSQFKRVTKKFEKQDEQKLTDKVESKFKVGDIIIHKENSAISKVNKILPYDYELISFETGNTLFLDQNIINENSKLWTIEDAKDGDVLATDSYLYMFKYTNNKALIQFHCECPINGKTYKWSFLPSDSYLDIYIDANIHPATKEQRDTLERAMTNAGYRWNKEEKKLEKI